jgi:signal transduction histidine kinase
MRTLLVLAQHPDFAEAVSAALNPEHYRVLHRANLDEAEPLLAHRLADACILDIELERVQGLWLFEKLRHKAPKCPAIIYTSARPWEWEEEAYLQGAIQVLSKPIRPRLLNAVLDRLWPVAEPTHPPKPAAPAPPDAPRPTEPRVPPGTAQTLSVLRDFSGILTHSLNAEGIIKQFLLLLREIVGINRAAVFLRQPFGSFGEAPGESHRLRAASAIGLSSSLLQQFELSFEGGIGGHLFRLGRILRRHGEEARNDVETQKEFELLGAQVAVPILDRETLLGVAIFDGRITGEPLVNSELELIFHLLEQLGLAIKNIWLHDQLAANHRMMADILRELSSACVVVSRDLVILHANKMARRYFTRADRRSSDLEFSDLPQLLGAKIYQVLKTGSAISTFKFEPEDAPGTIYSINIVPFHKDAPGLPASALLMAEDLTQSQQLQHLEVEAANLRLVKNMAVRLANEIPNALVSISTHQQLLAEKWKDPAFRTSLNGAMADSVKRIMRLVTQMRFLARDDAGGQEPFPLVPLIEEAYREACTHHPPKPAQFKCDSPSKPIVLSGNPSALKYALTEVILNGLQANATDPKIGVHLHAESGSNGRQGLQIEVEDNGAGFTPEATQKATIPFFTTRIVGLGLGLTVARKIIEQHGGKLEIVPPKSGQAGIVRISLLQDPTVATNG